MDFDEQLAEERLGEVINGKWTLERLLGVGGMAAVYAARDREGNVAAVKVLHPEMSRRADVRDRFLREGQIANRVAHPGVVQVRAEENAEGDTVALVMELLDGESLATVIDRKGLTVDDLLDVLDQVLDALAAAHDKGIVHRDLKPDNLFRTRDGKIKVLDFGIARVTDDVPGRHKTKTGVALGTVPYMAPEQALARRNQIDQRTDLFAIGAIAFRVLTDRHIHEAESDTELLIAMASTAAPAIRTIAPDVPPDLAAVIDVALAFSKDARYPDARTMQEDVRALRQGKSPPHASKKAGTRELATRVDLVAPVIPPSSSAPVSAFAPTERELAAVPPSSVRPQAAPPTPTEALPSPPTDVTAALDATKQSPAGAEKRKSRWPLAIAAAALAALGAATYFIVRPKDSDDAAQMRVIQETAGVRHDNPATSPNPPNDPAFKPLPSEHATESSTAARARSLRTEPRAPSSPTSTAAATSTTTSSATGLTPTGKPPTATTAALMTATTTSSPPPALPKSAPSQQSTASTSTAPTSTTTTRPPGKKKGKKSH